MNVQKLQAPGAPPASIRRSGSLEVTISDRGVDISRPPRPAAQAPGQVTSDPSLQSLLSPEEARALAQQFAAWRAPAESGKGMLYNGRGIAARALPALRQQGQLIDVVG